MAISFKGSVMQILHRNIHYNFHANSMFIPQLPKGSGIPINHQYRSKSYKHYTRYYVSHS